MCATKAQQATSVSTADSSKSLPNSRKARQSSKAPETQAQKTAMATLSAYVPHKGNVKDLGKVERINLARSEDAAVKAAKVLGEVAPLTPVRDFLASADYAKVQSRAAGNRSAPKVPGSNAQSTIEELQDRVRLMLSEGITSKGGMLKELRKRNLGANQQRFNKVAEPMIEAHLAKGTKASKSTAKAPASKAPAKVAAKRTPRKTVAKAVAA